MRRIALTIAYDGTAYSGWQAQANAVTVEGTLREAIRRLCGEEVVTIGASRTDAGVHALGNVVAFDTESPIPGGNWRPALNSFLPQDIRVMRSWEAEDDFHPRFNAHSKRYEYRIATDEVISPIRCRYVCGVRETLDLEAMAEGAKAFVGTHDYSAFCSAGAQTESKVRTVTRCEVYREGPEIVIGVEGDGFLYNMIRILAGTLIDMGRGAKAPESMSTILGSLDRAKAGPTAPPQGLMLVRIRYGEDER
jgi:pseudouridylate synthase I